MGLKESGLRGSLRSVSTGVSTIPDSGMFQDPIYQWTGPAVEVNDGTSPFDWPESLAELPDATAVGGPTFRDDVSGLSASEYDGVDDGHTTSDLDSQAPTGDTGVSIATTVRPRSSSGTQLIAYYGDDAGDGENFYVRVESGEYAVVTSDLGVVTGGSVTTDTWETVGATYDPSGPEHRLFVNGSQVASSNIGSVSLVDTEIRFATDPFGNDWYLDGYVHDAVYSATTESESAFADYHNDRLG